MKTQKEEIADLPITDEQADQTKGGDGMTLNYEKISYRQIEYDR